MASRASRLSQPSNFEKDRSQSEKCHRRWPPNRRERRKKKKSPLKHLPEGVTIAQCVDALWLKAEGDRIETPICKKSGENYECGVGGGEGRKGKYESEIAVFQLGM